MLRLEVRDYQGPTRWRWLLTDADTGEFVGDHQVDLNRDEWQCEAFFNLHSYLCTASASDRRRETEAAVVAQIGAWIGDQALGPVAAAVARAGGAVRLELDERTELLAYLPWELAHVDGRTLAAARVTFVVDLVDREVRRKREVGDALRVLAVFSLPERAGALSLRQERVALARLMLNIVKVHQKRIELRVIQYGATREQLAEALLDHPGWDVVHVSGHGLPAGLVLETESGGRDKITSAELVDLLALAAEQIKLVSLFACSSAAVTAERHLQLLGFQVPERSDDEPAGAAPLPAVATALVRRLDCMVVAMRHPVADEFAIGLSETFYDLLLGKGQPVVQALALAVAKTATELQGVVPSFSVATPTLFGAQADMKVVAPAGERAEFRIEGRKLAMFPGQPARLVGRVGPMTRASAALAPNSGRSCVLFLGMAGIGKTSAAVELAYMLHHTFGATAWYSAPPDGQSITMALSDFVIALEAQIPGLKLLHLLNDTASLCRELPKLTEMLEHERVLVVIDNAESLLSADGSWRDERWGMFIAALSGHSGLSRLVLTSRRTPAGLPSSALVEAVHALSLRESVLLARLLPNLRALMDGPHALLAARTLETVRGHPKLIEFAESLAGDPEALAARLNDTEMGDADYADVLAAWTRAAVDTLPPDSVFLLRFLCCLEDRDRKQLAHHDLWPGFWQRFHPDEACPPFATVVRPLAERALLAEHDEGLDIHPGVAETCRADAEVEFRAEVDVYVGGSWMLTLEIDAAAPVHEQSTMLILRAALSAMPYLRRGRQWLNLARAAESVLDQDPSARAAAAVGPVLQEALSACEGSCDDLGIAAVLTKAVSRTNPESAFHMSKSLLRMALAREEFVVAMAVASELVGACKVGGQPDEAKKFVEIMIDCGRRAEVGVWTQLAAEVELLSVTNMMGQHVEVLKGACDLLASMPKAEEALDGEHVQPHAIYEGLYEAAAAAATALGRWDLVLHLSANVVDSLRRRGALPTEVAHATLHYTQALRELKRGDEALRLLRWCRDVLGTSSVEDLGPTSMTLAYVEMSLGHSERATGRAGDALRAYYAMWDFDQIVHSHRVFAMSMGSSEAARRCAWAHVLAAVLAAGLSRSYDFDTVALWGATLAFSGFVKAELTPFDEVCALVEETDGVRFRELVDLFNKDGLSGKDLVEHAVSALNEHFVVLLERWKPFAEEVVANLEDSTALDAVLAKVEEQAVVDAVRRIQAGERDYRPFADVDEVTSGVVHRILDRLNPELVRGES
ncbi:CHAT domain-containing protein [Lentzea indica]|nr:CHAT domain-containing protein [Lentzea indica]